MLRKSEPTEMIENQRGEQLSGDDGCDKRGRAKSRRQNQRKTNINYAQSAAQPFPAERRQRNRRGHAQ